MLSKTKISAMLLCMAAPVAAAAYLHSTTGAAGAAARDERSRTIYSNLSLFDSVFSTLQPDMAIVVEGERIVDVLPVFDLTGEMTEKARIVDGSGWYVLPGLIEAHTHVATVPNQQRAEFLLNRQLYGGITSARDMAGDARFLANLQRASITHEIASPDIEFVALMGGPNFFSDPRTVSSGLGGTPGKLPWMQGITADTNHAEAVAIARGTYATAIKTYSHIDGPTLARIVGEARIQGIPVWSHAQIGPADSLEIARSGVHSMSHACDILSVAIPKEQNERARKGELGGGRPSVDVDSDDPRIDDVFVEMKKHGTMLDATLRLHRVMDEVFERRAREAQAQGSQARRGPPFRPGSVPAARAACDLNMAIEITRRAHEAGVGIITGTDGTANGDDPYPALYEELALLNERVGMDMSDVLKAATINGARSIGKEDEIGTIEPGKYANLMFTTENPLIGAASLKSVTLTVKRGREYRREDFSLRGPRPPER